MLARRCGSGRGRRACHSISLPSGSWRRSSRLMPRRPRPRNERRRSKSSSPAWNPMQFCPKRPSSVRTGTRTARRSHGLPHRCQRATARPRVAKSPQAGRAQSYPPRRARRTRRQTRELFPVTSVCSVVNLGFAFPAPRSSSAPKNVPPETLLCGVSPGWP
jgi:hypothetical protein